MMNFIKTVQTTNGNYAVFFNYATDYFSGVYLNRDGHLIRPMDSDEAEYCWKQWGSDTKSVVPKFHIPFLTIGRELEKYYRWTYYGATFASEEEAKKWIQEDEDFEFIEKYESISFMNKTIMACAIWYDDTTRHEKSFVNGKIVTGAHYFNVIS